VRQQLSKRLVTELSPILAKRRSDDIRQEVDSIDLLVKATKAFGGERVPSILAKQGVSRDLKGDVLVCAHAVPRSSLGREVEIDVGSPATAGAFLAPIGSTGYNDSGTNLDGLLRRTPDGKGQVDGYLQLFRDGRIESVDGHMAIGHGRDDGISAPALITRVRDFTADLVKFWKALNVPPPACAVISLHSANGRIPLLLPASGGYVIRNIDQYAFEFATIVITEFATDLTPLLRKPSDRLWQAVGFQRSTAFDAEGNWAQSR
jgi:hypothetical protein